MIAVSHLTFAYRRKPVFSDVCFTAAPGECLVLAGANGCGKSTLLSLLAGARRPRSGTVSVDGPIGFVPQGTGLLEDATAAENLAFFARLARAAPPDPPPYGLDRVAAVTAGRLSVGWQKRLSLACALCGDPPVLLLDEPCASLDRLFRETIIAEMGRLKAEGKCIVYVGHDPGEFFPFFDALLIPGDASRRIERAALGEAGRDEAAFGRWFAGALEESEKRKEETV